MTNEPTTGEIVKMLRTIERAAQVVLDSGFGSQEGENDIVYRTRRNIAKVAADRLESQDRTIAELTRKDEWAGHACDHMINKLRDEVRELTARAESAEAERDAAIADVPHTCRNCVGWGNGATEEPCRTCFREKNMWQWRGLQPQDGGENEN